MHPYATESSERARIYWALVIISLFAAIAINRGLEAYKLEVPWYVDLPLTPFALFYVLYELFDRSLWRCNWLHRWVNIPDISGEWSVKGVSAPGTPNQKDWTAKVKIQQTWSKICIVQITGQSRSFSTVAALSVDEASGAKLVHQYRNEPNGGAVKSMNIHYGTAVLDIELTNQNIVGEYYTGRGRETYGYFTYTRIN